jgi:hypothetical protein
MEAMIVWCLLYNMLVFGLMTSQGHMTKISITCFRDVSFNSFTGELPQTMNSLSSINTM